MDDLELTSEEADQLSTLPKEYWPCPLCIMTLMEAHGSGTVHNQMAFQALQNSGLVEDWPGYEGQRVQTTERGRAFVEMLLETPLPVQRWIDPRKDAQSVSFRQG